MKRQKQYLITLYQSRSIFALVAGIIVFFCTMAAEAYEFQNQTSLYVENPAHYFTILSNFMASVGAAFMIPYAVEGIRKKRFILPRWIVVFQYSGAVCVAITMVSALLIILPTQGSMAVKGTNFWLHIITPAFTVGLFESVETGVFLTRRNMVLAQIPYWCYMALYFVMVILVGKENGGWADIYMTQAFWPAWISAVLMLAVGFGVAAVLRYVQNRRAAESLKRISRLWADGLTPTELRVEAFGLGRYMGKNCDPYNLEVPVDIFNMLSDRYDVSVEVLTKAFIKGALDSLAGK